MSHVSDANKDLGGGDANNWLAGIYKSREDGYKKI